MAEAFVALGAIVLTDALQPYVYPPSDQWRTPVAAVGVLISLMGIVLFLIGRGSGGEDAPVQRTNAGGDGHGSRQASSVAGRGNTVTQAGRDAIGTQINVGYPANEFKDAPHLNWGTQKYVTDGRDVELQVLCTINGQDARIDPRSLVTSSDLLDRIDFEGFDTSDLIRMNPGTFWLRIRLKRVFPGDREIRWRVVYFDTHMARGYVTECSIPVTVVDDQMQLNEKGGVRGLDLVSPRDRHERYVREYGAAKHAGSTG